MTSNIYAQLSARIQEAGRVEHGKLMFGAHVYDNMSERLRAYAMAEGFQAAESGDVTNIAATFEALAPEKSNKVYLTAAAFELEQQIYGLGVLAGFSFGRN